VVNLNPVAHLYQTWWISPAGDLYDAVRRGIPGHCAWLEEVFGICSREEARQSGWVRVGWNMYEFYVDGRLERVRAAHHTIEELLLDHPAVTRVVLETGSDLWSVLTPQQFLERGYR